MAGKNKTIDWVVVPVPRSDKRIWHRKDVKLLPIDQTDIFYVFDRCELLLARRKALFLVADAGNNSVCRTLCRLPLLPVSAALATTNEGNDGL